jgi:hypothetical protein
MLQIYSLFLLLSNFPSSKIQEHGITATTVASRARTRNPTRLRQSMTADDAQNGEDEAGPSNESPSGSKKRKASLNEATL